MSREEILNVDNGPRDVGIHHVYGPGLGIMCVWHLTQQK